MNLGAGGGPVVGSAIRPLRESTTGGPVIRRPLRSTGLVDAATTDLAEIRSISQSMSKTNKTDILSPGEIAGAGRFENFRKEQIEEDANDPVNRPGGFNVIPRLTRANIESTSPNPDRDVLSNIQNWMREAFPANSFGDPSSLTAESEVYIRMRAEQAPPDYFTASSLVDDLERTYRRADQLMLTSSVFVPRCSELIIEWSFGQADTTGRLVWYGGKETPGIAGNTFRLYPGLPSLKTDEDTWYRPFSTAPNHRLSPYLIYDAPALANFEPATAAAITNAQATAHFGYIDPTWPGAGTPSATEPRTLPWAWPKLIRVTMTLSDPVDAAIEETFQFVFDVPEDPMP
jgi:hypothetical protein